MDSNIIFDTNKNTEQVALQLFAYQYANCNIYRQYVNAIHCDVAAVDTFCKIPFLPIQFFKTHQIITDNCSAELLFKSSGTTSQTTATHHVANKHIYEQSFTQGYQHFYNAPKQSCIIGLLPSYVENGDSSLVYMVNHFINESTNADSGIYLYDFAKLATVLQHNSLHQIDTLLIGVTYALLDFASQYAMPLNDCITIMETGGMKGRGVELTRMQVHQQLRTAFGLQYIHSEYGMTELLSQAYSKANGLFECSSTMQVLIRDINDPLQTLLQGKGALNIIDLANIHSCSFIATQDVGEVLPDGTFYVNGRIDASDVRGCNMLVM
jgi:hypothetical protein